MPVEQSGNPLSQLVPFMIIGVIFYLLIWRPDSKKQQQKKERIANLKKNDEIITSGGIHGTVVNIKPETFIIRVDDNVKIEIDKESVLTVKEKTTKGE